MSTKVSKNKVSKILSEPTSEVIASRSKKLQQSLDEVIQGIKDGQLSLIEIVKTAIPVTVRPKMSKEERKAKKSAYYQEWYQRNKEYFKVWREKHNIKKLVLNKENVFNKGVFNKGVHQDAISSAFEDGNAKAFED